MMAEGYPAGSREDREAVRLRELGLAPYLVGLVDRAAGREMKAGQVRQLVYWLLDGDEVVGRVVLRPELNEILARVGGHIGYVIRPSRRRQGYGKEILRLTLARARTLGLSRVLLTCNDDNPGSIGVIEACGGQLAETIMYDEPQPHLVRRYWIEL
jgi:predicted acetyltransferase